MTHILKSEIKIEPCTMPWRIVLHRYNGSLVTHCETLEGKVTYGREGPLITDPRHQGYHHGHYHTDDAEGRILAVLDFGMRCKLEGVAPAI